MNFVMICKVMTRLHHNLLRLLLINLHKFQIRILKIANLLKNININNKIIKMMIFNSKLEMIVKIVFFKRIILIKNILVIIKY